MKLRSLFSQHFFFLFGALPLLCGCALLLFFLSTQQAFPGTSLLSHESFIGDVLMAGVYPDFDEVPDGNLPQGNIEDEFLPTLIDILLALMSTVVLVTLLVSATLFIIHFGDEEKLKNAKALLKWAAVGVIIIIVAYATVRGVTQLTFERPS